MNEYMKTYQHQMDQITLSAAADQRILSDLRQAAAQRTTPRRRKRIGNMRAAVIAAAILIAALGAVAVGAAVHAILVRAQKTASAVAEHVTAVSLGESYYYDLLGEETGTIYAMTDSDHDHDLTDQQVIVWRSTDQADSWESVFTLPDQLNEGSSLIEGDLWMGSSGIEAMIITDEPDPAADGAYHRRVYRIATDSCTEYNMDEVYARLGSQEHLYNVLYVNDHTIALAAADTCLLYDTETREIIKELPYNLTMGFLLTQNRFLIYGKEVYTCLNADTLQEQAPEPELLQFVQTVYEANGSDILPPMQGQDDSIICVTESGLYEYRNRETTQVRQLSRAIYGGHPVNGLLPACRAGENDYYVCTFYTGGMVIWQISTDAEEMK